MKKIKYKKFDQAVIEDLKQNSSLQRQYLQTILDEYEKDSNISALLISLKHIVIAKGGFAELAKKTGISRQGLYKALSAKGKPRFHTIKIILQALGCKFSFQVSKGRNFKSFQRSADNAIFLN